jgi:hypothetical protein
LSPELFPQPEDDQEPVMTNMSRRSLREVPVASLAIEPLQEMLVNRHLAQYVQLLEGLICKAPCI